MKKFSYVFSHTIFKIFAFALIICVASFLINDSLLQLNSQKNGIEIILYDTTLSTSAPELFCNQIKKETSVRYVNFTTLDSASTEDYVSTIKNFTVYNYISQLALSRNAELLIVPESMLADTLLIEGAVPLNIEIDPDQVEKCSLNGQVYAFPFLNKIVTDYGDTFTSAYLTNVYGILLSGDHTEQVRAFLASIN